MLFILKLNYVIPFFLPILICCFFLIFQKVLLSLDKNTDYLISDKTKKKQAQNNKASESIDVSTYSWLKYKLNHFNTSSFYVF